MTGWGLENSKETMVFLVNLKSSAASSVFGDIGSIIKLARHSEENDGLKTCCVLVLLRIYSYFIQSLIQTCFIAKTSNTNCGKEDFLLFIFYTFFTYPHQAEGLRGGLHCLLWTMEISGQGNSRLLMIQMGLNTSLFWSQPKTKTILISKTVEKCSRWD